MHNICETIFDTTDASMYRQSVPITIPQYTKCVDTLKLLLVIFMRIINCSLVRH